MRFWVVVCLGILIFAPPVGGRAFNGSTCERALLASTVEIALSASIGEKAFFINGVDAEEFLPLKAYLGDSLPVINSDADCLEFYMPVTEICFKGSGGEDALVLMVPDNEPIILTNEIPCYYAGCLIESGEIPIDARGLLFFGKEDEFLLLYFYPDTLWGRVLAVDSRHETILLSVEEGRADSKSWYDLSPQLWAKLLPDLQRSDLVQVHIDRRNNGRRIIDIKVLDY